jgi:hypothetical protein
MQEIQQYIERDDYPRSAVHAAEAAISVCQLLEEHPKAGNSQVLQMRVKAGKAAIMFAEMAIFMLSTREEVQLLVNKASLEAWVADARLEVSKLEDRLAGKQKPS